MVDAYVSCVEAASFKRQSRTQHLAEILAAQQPDQRARGFLEAVDDILAVFDRPPRTHADTSRRKSPWRAAKSVTMKPRRVSRLVRIARVSAEVRNSPAGISVAL